MRDKRFVYVVKEKGTTFYRIGSTHSFDSRKKILKQGNPREIELIYIEEFQDPSTVMWVEKLIQNIVSKYRHKDSWYNIPDMGELEYNIGYELMRLRMEHEVEFMRIRHLNERDSFTYKEYCRNNIAA